jgi:hypothetical protein
MTAGLDIYRVGLCAMSACAPIDMSREDIEGLANLLHPTGIASRWQISDSKTFSGGEPNPCPCNDHSTERQHYLLSC